MLAGFLLLEGAMRQGYPSSILADNFVPNGPGRLTNKPVLIGDPANIVHKGGQDVATMPDGRVFTRPDHYAVFSPYGWKEVHHV
jgi:hypothetical protein